MFAEQKLCKSKPRTKQEVKLDRMGTFSWMFDVPGLEVYVTIFAIGVYFIVSLLKLKKEDRRMSRYLNIILVATVGINGIEAIIWGILQMIAAREFSKEMGFEESILQIQVAFGYISVGIINFPVLFNQEFILPATMSKSVFSWGIAISHLYDWIENNNTSIHSIGTTLWYDIFLPIIVILFYIFNRIDKWKQRLEKLKKNVDAQETDMIESVMTESTTSTTTRPSISSKRSSMPSMDITITKFTANDTPIPTNDTPFGVDGAMEIIFDVDK